ncbi:hypothetical protein FE257_000762 [Aspergillus nanangensis]|uniref:Uncharacterized protein n=1 Tax=Aspergillus nanangensis TaxID=2582783 RepID=A0AAD4CEI9_ASPNN|nr:hypothetical protein FE257_000762 [Aspergillus nanangensis]
MKFQLTTLAGLLLPLLTLATPTPEPADVPFEVRDASPEALGLTKRSATLCKIVNTGSASVNCRTGPGFDYPASFGVGPGKSYSFSCYKTGDCYEGNCTWDRISWDGKVCYVNGYYTDSRCTIAALGKC